MMEATSQIELDIEEGATPEHPVLRPPSVPQNDPALAKIQERMTAVAKALVASKVFDGIPTGNKIIYEACKAAVVNDANARSYLRGVINVSCQISKRKDMVEILRKILRYKPT